MVVVTATAATLLWRHHRGTPAAETVDTYAFVGAAPGDLAPSIAIDDNVRNYGIDADIEYHFTTDNLGFRTSGPRTTGRPVVLVVGDSFAFGMGVEDSETFPFRLAAALSSTFPDVVVHNAGIPGYTITDQLEQWRAKLSTVKVDLVLVCHTASDLREMARPTSLRRFMAWDDESPEMDAAVAAVVRRHGNKRTAAEAEYVVPESSLITRLGAGVDAAFRRYRDAWVTGFDQLVSAVHATQPNARVALVLWARGYGQGALDTTPVASHARARGVATFEGAAALEGGGVPLDALFLPDKHFSPSGNALAARQTAEWLVSTGVLHADH